MRWLPALLALVGCSAQPEAPTDRSAGSKLEAAAMAAGLIVDPARAAIDGAWALDTDRACIVPGGMGGAHRIGVVLDYGEGQGCTGRGEVTRRGNGLSLRFGDCRFDARFDGERIMFPDVLPGECDRLCRGRASLSAMTVERISGSISEAQTLRATDGTSLCAP